LYSGSGENVGGNGLEDDPHFWDIGFADNCNATTGSCTSSFGNSYTNDTELNRATFFMGGTNFKGKEIEAFGIAARTALRSYCADNARAGKPIPANVFPQN
jgi:hypothetical protein